MFIKKLRDDRLDIEAVFRAIVRNSVYNVSLNSELLDDKTESDFFKRMALHSLAGGRDSISRLNIFPELKIENPINIDGEPIPALASNTITGRTIDTNHGIIATGKYQLYSIWEIDTVITFDSVNKKRKIEKVINLKPIFVTRQMNADISNQYVEAGNTYYVRYRLRLGHHESLWSDSVQFTIPAGDDNNNRTSKPVISSSIDINNFVIGNSVYLETPMVNTAGLIHTYTDYVLYDKDGYIVLGKYREVEDNRYKFEIPYGVISEYDIYTLYIRFILTKIVDGEIKYTYSDISRYDINIIPKILVLKYKNIRDLPMAIAEHSQITINESEVILTGGVIRYDTDTIGINHYTFLYNINSDSWRTLRNITYPIKNHAQSLLLDNSVLVTGGILTDGRRTNFTQRFFPNTNTWILMEDLPVKISHHAQSTLSNGVVVISGGIDTNGDISNKVYTFNPFTRIWVELSDVLPRGLYGHSQATLSNNRIIIYNGNMDLGNDVYPYNGGDGILNNMVYILEINDDGSYTIHETAGDTNHNAYSISTFSGNDEIVFIGGSNHNTVKIITGTVDINNDITWEDQTFDCELDSSCGDHITNLRTNVITNATGSLIRNIDTDPNAPYILITGGYIGVNRDFTNKTFLL